MNEKQRITLIFGLLLIALCALFPPRRYTGNTISVNDSTVAPRSFLWTQQLHQIKGGGHSYRVEIDTAKLMAEVIAFAALTGVVFLRETLTQQ